MPLNLFAGLPVQNESNRELVVVPHASSDVVTVTKFVRKSVTLGIKKQSSNTTESLSGEEFDLGIRIGGIDKTF